MHHSDTCTYGGNNYTYHVCRRCMNEISMCVCWWDFMELLEQRLEWKKRMAAYKSVLKNSIWIKVIDLIRKTPSSISGMRGRALRKREDSL